MKVKKPGDGDAGGPDGIPEPQEYSGPVPSTVSVAFQGGTMAACKEHRLPQSGYQ